jgi:hypothetical protein
MMRRGFVLIAVLVVIAAAVLVATGAIFAARGATVSSRAAELERRLRDAALDGVRVAAERLAQDRREILAGAVPKGTVADGESSLLLAIPDGGRSVEVRLVPQPSGALYASEAAKLDAGTAAGAALARLADDAPEVARAIVERIIAERSGRGGPPPSIDGTVALAAGFSSDEALSAVLGPLQLLGSEREARDEDGGGAGQGGRAVDRSTAPPLVELLTVHGAEPLVDATGSARLDLVAAFEGNSSGGRAEASLDLLEDAEQEALEALVRKRGGAAADAQRGDDGSIAAALLARGVEPARVDRIMDECTLEAGTHGVPRVDIVRADLRVLAAVDGIGPDAAARIVDLRGTLDETERGGTSWLVTRRVLSVEQYGAVAGRITHRSALWRFRVEARMVAADDAGDDASAGGSEPASLAAFDCIVDVSPERPRIVFLRDVTLLATARALAVLSAGALGAAGDGAGFASEGDSMPDERVGEDAVAPDATESDLDSDTASDAAPDVERSDARRAPRPTSRLNPSSRFDLPAENATMNAPPARGRVRPSGRDVGGAEAR